MTVSLLHSHRVKPRSLFFVLQSGSLGRFGVWNNELNFNRGNGISEINCLTDGNKLNLFINLFSKWLRNNYIDRTSQMREIRPKHH
jgi:hypothetical protein